MKCIAFNPNDRKMNISMSALKLCSISTGKFHVRRHGCMINFSTGYSALDLTDLKLILNRREQLIFQWVTRDKSLKIQPCLKVHERMAVLTLILITILTQK